MSEKVGGEQASVILVPPGTRGGPAGHLPLTLAHRPGYLEGADGQAPGVSSVSFFRTHQPGTGRLHSPVGGDAYHE